MLLSMSRGGLAVGEVPGKTGMSHSHGGRTASYQAMATEADAESRVAFERRTGRSNPWSSRSCSTDQVGAVRHKLPQARDDDRDALGRVEQAGRTALAEMRRLLGAMCNDGDGVELGPQPGLDALDSLIEDVSRAGLPVRVHVDGGPFRLPRAIDLLGYRIVQEALTNALKHARASHADVTVRYRPDELELKSRRRRRGPRNKSTATATAFSASANA